MLRRGDINGTSLRGVRKGLRAGRIVPPKQRRQLAAARAPRSSRDTCARCACKSMTLARTTAGGTPMLPRVAAVRFASSTFGLLSL